METNTPKIRREYRNYTKRGIEKGIEKGIGKTLIRLLTRKFGDISSDYKNKIENANEHTLTEIVDHIFEINKIEDLDEYLK